MPIIETLVTRTSRSFRLGFIHLGGIRWIFLEVEDAERSVHHHGEPWINSDLSETITGILEPAVDDTGQQGYGLERGSS